MSGPKQPFKSAQNHLAEFRRLIRTGLQLTEEESLIEDADTQELRNQIKGHIEALDKEPEDLLHYLTLKTEYYYAFGLKDLQKTAETLRTHVDKIGLTGKFQNWSQKKPNKGQSADHSKTAFHLGETPKTFRRKIWALMALAFYSDLENGAVDTAIASLEKLKQIVTEELPLCGVQQYREPFGTLAKLHEFLAQCYRQKGEFAIAERHFLEAQVNIERRLRRELRSNPDRIEARQEAYQYSVICTARVFGGFGRSAMLQGQLARAEMMLRGARTLLRPTGLSALKGVVASHLSIVERRLSNPDDPDWDSDETRKLEHLKELYRKFILEPSILKEAKTGSAATSATSGQNLEEMDLDGARRCAQEVALAYLEAAETRPADQRCKQWLDEAHIWVVRLGALADHRRKDGPNIELFRVWLLQAYLHCLVNDLPSAEAALTEARKMQNERFRARYCADPGGFDPVNIELTDGILKAAKAKARMIDITEVASHFEALIQQSKKRNNVVLEAETILRWAGAEAEAGREEAAQTLLERWEPLKHRVETVFLRDLEEIARKNIRRNWRITFPTLDIPAAKLRIERELYFQAKFLTNGDTAEMMKLLNVSDNTVKNFKSVYEPDKNLKPRLKSRQKAQ